MRSPSFPAHHCRKSTSPGSVKSAGPACSHCQGHLVADLYIDKIDAGGHVWIAHDVAFDAGLLRRRDAWDMSRKDSPETTGTQGSEQRGRYLTMK